MKKQIDDIKAIRAMMEKSSKFLSLSGLSGVIAGTMAILGAAFAYFYLLRAPWNTDFTRMQEMMILLADGIVVLAVSLGAGVYFSRRKAKRTGQEFFGKIARKTLYALAVPLVTGGVFALTYLLRGDVQTVIAATLLFYGLALVNASRFIYGEVHYLGLTEIVLGLLAAIFPHNGLLFWTLGFGLCHIVYGLIMYRKYDIKRDGEHPVETK